MDSETNLIFEQYKQVNENIGLGPNGMSTVTITVGSNTNHPPRRQPGGTTFSAFSDEEHADVKKEEEAVYIQAGNASDDDCGCSDCNGDHDGEIDMARAELLKAAEYATKLFNHLQDVDNLEGWTASKITKASDYLSSVYHALEYDALDANVEDEEVDDELEEDVTEATSMQFKDYKKWETQAKAMGLKVIKTVVDSAGNVSKDGRIAKDKFGNFRGTWAIGMGFLTEDLDDAAKTAKDTGFAGA